MNNGSLVKFNNVRIAKGKYLIKLFAMHPPQGSQCVSGQAVLSLKISDCEKDLMCEQLTDNLKAFQFSCAIQEDAKIPLEVIYKGNGSVALKKILIRSVE